MVSETWENYAEDIQRWLAVKTSSDAVEPLPLLADATGADEGIGRDDRGSETELAKGAEAGPECRRSLRLGVNFIYGILSDPDSFKIVKG